MLLKKSSSSCADRHGQDGSPFGLDGMIISADESEDVFAEQGAARQAVKAKSDAHSRLGRRRLRRFCASCVGIVTDRACFSGAVFL